MNLRKANQIETGIVLVKKHLDNYHTLITLERENGGWIDVKLLRGVIEGTPIVKGDKVTIFKSIRSKVVGEEGAKAEIWYEENSLRVDKSVKERIEEYISKGADWERLEDGNWGLIFEGEVVID